MFSFLKNHPFAVEAFFERSIVLTFAVPKEQILHLVPKCVSLDVFNEQWAFIAIAMVQTRELRPKGFPKILGNNFFLTGYRVFVKFKNNAGKTLRGLYILKSETDKKKMEILGNIFTHYRYTTTDIELEKQGNIEKIYSLKSGFKLIFENDIAENISLPNDSPFMQWKEARRYAGPLPFTFTYNSTNKQILIIEGVRQNWHPKPIRIIDYHFDFLERMRLNNIRLANAFILEDIPYHWKKGRIEQWIN